ncbi:MAG: hypothetical protein ACUVX8_02225 [Candidatus Zipacnadales bacterium]
MVNSKQLPQDSLFDAVKAQDVGVFGIKPFASNSLFKGNSQPGNPMARQDDELARLTIRYILANDAITAPLPALINTHQVENVARAVCERRELDLAKQAKLNKAAAEMIANLPPNTNGCASGSGFESVVLSLTEGPHEAPHSGSHSHADRSKRVRLC